MTRAGWLVCLLLPAAIATAGDKYPRSPEGRTGAERILPEPISPEHTAGSFTSQPIDDTILKRIRGKSYKDDCPVPVEDLRYLRVSHYDLNHEIRQGELICHKAISRDLLEIFQALFKAGYPIGKMILVDEYGADDELSMRDNNTSCFNFRRVTGSSKPSSHSRGCAIDINPLYNPYVRKAGKGRRKVIRPTGSEKYADRSAGFPCKIDRDDTCYKEFKKRGFSWGGDWRSLKDYQHFEKTR